MKSYKQLKKQLMESEYVDGGALGQWPTPDSIRSATSDFGIHRIEHSQEVQRLQAFLNAFTGREYIDPRAALSLMRVKLNLAGIDFDFNKKTEVPIGTPIHLHLKQWGGTFGVTPTTPHNKFETTDGISDKLDGNHLCIVLTITEAPSGLYKMNAEIVRYKDNPEQGVSVKATSVK